MTVLKEIMDNGIGTEYSLADAMARFISEDPIGLAGGINMYAYVGNSPLNFVDPLGESAAVGVIRGAQIGGSFGGPWGAVGGAIVGGIAGLILSDIIIDEISDPPDESYDRDDDICKKIWEADTAWCAAVFTGECNGDCRTWAEKELLKCPEPPREPFEPELAECKRQKRRGISRGLGRSKFFP